MSVSLFFAGISTKLHTPRLRMITLGVGCTVFRVHSALDGDVPGQRLGLEARRPIQPTKSSEQPTIDDRGQRFG